MSFNNISFILNKPQLSENIGSCARAMKNFNFSKLIIIKPKPIFPNDKIYATSVGAKEIITKAKIYEDINESLGNFDYLIATSSRSRNKNIQHITLEDLKKINFKSLNLSHSLIIVCQALFSIFKKKSFLFKKSNKIQKGTKKQIQAMIDLCINNLDKINFFYPKEKKPIMLENLRNIFYRMELSEKEIRILSSVFANLAKKKVD